MNIPTPLLVGGIIAISVAAIGLVQAVLVSHRSTSAKLATTVVSDAVSLFEHLNFGLNAEVLRMQGVIDALRVGEVELVKAKQDLIVALATGEIDRAEIARLHAVVQELETKLRGIREDFEKQVKAVA